MGACGSMWANSSAVRATMLVSGGAQVPRHVWGACSFAGGAKKQGSAAKHPERCTQLRICNASCPAPHYAAIYPPEPPRSSPAPKKDGSATPAFTATGCIRCKQSPCHPSCAPHLAQQRSHQHGEAPATLNSSPHVGARLAQALPGACPAPLDSRRGASMPAAGDEGRGRRLPACAKSLRLRREVASWRRVRLGLRRGS